MRRKKVHTSLSTVSSQRSGSVCAVVCVCVSDGQPSGTSYDERLCILPVGVGRRGEERTVSLDMFYRNTRSNTHRS